MPAVKPSTLPTTQVQLADGQQIAAAVDRQTDRGQLVVRWEGPRGYLTRSVAWSDVRSATLADVLLSAGQFRAAVLAAVQATGGSSRPPAGGYLVERNEPPQSPAPASRRIAFLRVEAAPGHWDADVAVDGLAVTVELFDAEGAAVAADATVEIELIGETRGRVNAVDPFGIVERWTRRLTTADFARGPALVRCPYATLSPDARATLAPHGAVYVRAAVAGHGVFQATATDVRLDFYSAVRDRRSVTGGGRYFAAERTR